jgi:polar amino acid transport system substrate-binding protein
MTLTHRCILLIVLSVTTALASAGATGADEAIAIYYNERPPYLATDAATHQVTGLTAAPTAAAFRAAGLAARWASIPTNRQLALLKASTERACAVGWFKNPERAALFKYTKAIYRDKPTVALARAGYEPTARRLAVALHESGLRVLMKDRFSYGPWIDALMADIRPQAVTTSEENVQMVRMIAGGRADFMFASEEEAAYLITQSGVSSAAVRILHFDDVPPGERRYLLCAKAVPDDVIERLDRAIRFE